MSMPKLLDDDDAFLPEVQIKPALKTRSKGVVRKSIGYDDEELGQEEHTGTKRMQTRGFILVNKSINLADDSQDADTTNIVSVKSAHAMWKKSHGLKL